MLENSYAEFISGNGALGNYGQMSSWGSDSHPTMTLMALKEEEGPELSLWLVSPCGASVILGFCARPMLHGWQGLLCSWTDQNQVNLLFGLLSLRYFVIVKMKKRDWDSNWTTTTTKKWQERRPPRSCCYRLIHTPVFFGWTLHPLCSSLQQVSGWPNALPILLLYKISRGGWFDLISRLLQTKPKWNLSGRAPYNHIRDGTMFKKFTVTNQLGQHVPSHNRIWLCSLNYPDTHGTHYVA